MARLGRLTPCWDCPYRRNATAGWLGRDEPVPFVAKAYYGEQDAPCHVQINYSDPEWLETQEPTADLCAGALIFMRNSLKVPRDEKMAAAVRSVNPSSKVFATCGEFIAHHTHRPEPYTPLEADIMIREWSNSHYEQLEREGRLD